RGTKSTAMRRMIGDGRLRVRPGAYDAFSARILERAGFEWIGISGYAVSVTLLGKPDVGLVDLTETARIASYVCAAVDVPVMVDCDTGYGNAINAMRTVEMIIAAGAGGLFIEDQVEPKRCGHVSGKQVVPMEEAVGKIRAAARVRDGLDPDFVLMARTDARGAAGGSFDEALRRGLAYAEAGADMIFPEGLISADEIAAYTDALGKPISYNRTGVSPMLDLATLERMGVCMVANATGGLRAATRAMWDYMQGLADSDVAFLASMEEGLHGHETADLDEFLGLAGIEAAQAEFMPGSG
ncbi:MAG: isocitrate lyase/PEP mutase family protein, partial [Alphaproteobacteria bacterium]